jgi:small-conductance mechanosensitive channel
MDLFNPIYLFSKNKRELSEDLILYLYILLLIFIIYNITNLILSKIYPTKETTVIYNRRRITRYAFSIIGMICIIPVFYSRIGNLPTILAFTGAGLVISLKDITLNFIGWFLIHNNNGFSLGDRLEIDGVKGDVVNIGIMRFTLLEISSDDSSDQSTNRLVHIPNHQTLTKKLYVSSGKMEFIWDELKILLTLSSDFEEAEKICNDILKEFIGLNEKKFNVEERFRGLSENYLLKIGITTPIVYTSIQDGGILLCLRYLTRIQEKRDIRSKLFIKILKEFRNKSNIEIFGNKHPLFIDRKIE